MSDAFIGYKLRDLEITIGAAVQQLDRIEKKVDGLLAALQPIEKELKNMSKEIDDLAAQVEANTTVEASAATLIQGIAQQIADNAGDRQKTVELAAKLKTSADALTAAVVANTPAAPATTPASA